MKDGAGSATSTGSGQRSTAGGTATPGVGAESALRLPTRPASWWHRAGVSMRGERVFDVVGGVVLVVLATAWMWSIAASGGASWQRSERGVAWPPSAASTLTAALTNSDAPSAAFLTDAALDAVARSRGVSGKLRASIAPSSQPIRADTLPPGASVLYTRGGDSAGAARTAPRGAGVWGLALAIGDAIRPVANFSLITLHPFAEKQNGRLGLYYIGRWPGERRRAPRPPIYAKPQGFIEVTADNQDTRLSEHFTLRDFLTHDQPDVWPKYMVLQMKLIDKLELVLTDLQEHGVNPGGVRVMSGFRTPQYNARGGNPQGRAALSRHMYGDAADIFIDNDGTGQMNDLNHDGRISIEDARVILAAVDRVEAAHPELVGGTGVYTAAAGHGPFIHIDTRGYRARWTGTSGG